jgi:hypothetical protein
VRLVDLHRWLRGIIREGLLKRIDSFVMENHSKQDRKSWLWLIAAGGVALIFKAVLLAVNAFPFNSDEAIVALMARHILQGERPIFFYGQAYMGSLDAYIVAAGFSAFGQQVWVVRAVQAALYLGTLLTTAALGRAVFFDRRVGLLAIWLLAIPTVNVTLYTTVSLGGYGEMLLIGNLILLCALALGRNPWQTGIRPDAFCLALGLLSGFGLWAFGLTLVYSLPAIVYIVWQAWRTGRTNPGLASGRVAVRRIGLCVLGGIAGSAPWWGYARSAGLQSLLGELGGSAIAGVEGISWLGQVFQHTVNLVLFGGTVITGMRPPWEIQWLAEPLMPLVLAVWMGALVYSALKIFQVPVRIRESSRLERRAVLEGNARPVETRDQLSAVKPGNTFPGDWLLVGVGLTLAAGFIFTPFGADPSGRYFLPLAVILALFVAQAVVDWRSRWGGWVYGLVSLILLFNLWGTVQLARFSPPGLSTQIDISTQIDRRYDSALVEFLLKNGERRGYTTYWVAYPLAFLSGEQLIYQPRLPYHLDFRHTTRDDRYAPYAEQVSASERVAYITVRHPELDKRLRQGFERLGIRFQEAVIGDYHVFYALSRSARPEELGL